MKSQNTILLILLFFLQGFFSSESHAQYLNSNFATNGYTQDILSYGNGHEIIVQPDNKILVSNQRRYYYANTNGGDKFSLFCNRYNQDGSLDVSFGLNGIAQIPHNNDAEVLAMALQSDGKIILAGQSTYCGNIVCGFYNLAIGRLNSDGSADMSFGTNGTLKAEDILGPMFLSSRISTVKTLSSGKILISGVATISTDGTTANYVIRPFVARLNNDGSFDTTFGPTNTGISYVNQFSISLAYDMLFAADGSMFWLVRQNYQSALIKLSSDGILDSNFGSGGAYIIDIGTNSAVFHTMDMRSDNKLVVGGYIHTNNTLDSSLVVVVNPNGTMYSQVGQSVIDIPMNNGRINAVKCMSNNRVLIAGTLICDTSAFLNNAYLGFVGLVKEDGTYDNSFSNDGIITFDLAPYGNWSRTSIEDLKVLSNGDILCTGGRFATVGSTKSQVLLMSINSEGTIVDETSLETLTDLSDLQVYPNPLTETSVLSFSNVENMGNVEIELYDISGRHLHTYFSGVPNAGMNTFELNSGVQIKKGNYLIRVKSDNSIQTIKVQM